LKEEIKLNENVMKTQKANQLMKEHHIKTIQDKVNRMNSFFAAKAESLNSDGQEGVLNYSRYDELKNIKIQDLQNTLQNKETAR
jgi:hypothetical protein